MIKFDRILIGAVTGGSLSVALAQIAAFVGGEARVAGAVQSDPLGWLLVAAISGACAGGGLTVLFSKDD
jgi:xanthine/CO dehydrogenase XdhC/CoxF family maturation factor